MILNDKEADCMYRLIIIDDEELFRKNLINKIDWCSYGITIAGEAENGREALEIIRKIKPDIVICDIKMPIMDGISVLKNMENIGHTKFIILSGYNDFEFTRHAIMYGAFDYILKPLKEEELVGVLIRAVESLNKDIKKQTGNIKLNIELRKVMVERYKSLFMHFTESRDINSICMYIDNFYSEFDTASHSDLLGNSLIEFNILADEICRIFKLDAGPILDNYRAGNLIISPGTDKEAISVQVKKIFCEIINQLITAKNSEGKKIVNDVIEYIDSNYNEKISLESIARRYYINPSYFSQLFKLVSNHNFSTYLIEKRVQKARELLELGNLKVYQVSKMVGYDDDKHFSQIFKKYTGYSPTEYCIKKQAP
jgi:Response regulator containing CheY-like receiver domain and AraC-type DNA-binding domain